MSDPVEKEETREELYKQYQEQQQADAPPAEEKKEEPKAEPTPEEVENKEEVKEEVKEEKKETKQPDPHDAEKWKAATYEERMKRKAVNETLEKERARTATLEARIKQLESQKSEEPVEEVITDYDKALLDVKKELRDTKLEIKAIKETESERVEREKFEAIERAKKETGSQIDQAHKDLLGEGFYGFKHSIGRIQEELFRLVREDEANAHFDNPAGWKKIYKEIVFPELRAEQEAADKARAVSDKTKLKEQANLAGPGSKPVKKAEEAKTERERQEEYLRMRRGE